MSPTSDPPCAETFLPGRCWDALKVSEQKRVQALTLLFLSAAIQEFELWGLSPDQILSVPPVVAVAELSLALFICDGPPFQLHLNSWFFPVAGRQRWWLRLLLYWTICSNKRQAPKDSLGGIMNQELFCPPRQPLSSRVFLGWGFPSELLWLTVS